MFDNKVLNFKDSFPEIREKITTERGSGTFFDTEVEFQNEFGETLMKKKNLIVLRGRTFALEKIFNKNLKKSGLPYNADVPEASPAAGRKVCLFSVGLGGSGLTFGDVYKPIFSDLAVSQPLPFRYVDIGMDLGLEASKYVGKQVLGTKEGYFLKKFEAEPVFKHGGDSGDEDEVYIELKLKVNKDDLREYAIANGGLEDCRMNELSLFFALENPDGTFSQIEMFSRLTFNNEPMDNETRELNIFYRIYA